MYNSHVEYFTLQDFEKNAKSGDKIWDCLSYICKIKIIMWVNENKWEIYILLYCIVSKNKVTDF